MHAPPRPGNPGDPARSQLPGRVSVSESQLAPNEATLFLQYIFHFYFPLFICLYRARRDTRQSVVADFDCALRSIHFTRIYFFHLHFCGRACRDLQNTRFGEVCMY